MMTAGGNRSGPGGQARDRRRRDGSAADRVAVAVASGGDRDADRTGVSSLRVADVAALGPRLGDLDALALQHGVDGVAQVLLGDLVLVLAVIHRAGVADGPGLVED